MTGSVLLPDIELLLTSDTIRMRIFSQNEVATFAQRIVPLGVSAVHHVPTV